jgi:DNA-binding response OmpR family regulator
MCIPLGYLLVLAPDIDKQIELEPLLSRLEKSLAMLGEQPKAIAVANSVDQAIAWIDQQPPYLLILAGEQPSWSSRLVQHCRSLVNQQWITLLALTQFDTPTWMTHEANPGFDGFLVQPLNIDVLVPLIQAAQLRRACVMDAAIIA